MRFALVAFSAAVLATVAGCSDAPPPVPDGAFNVTTTQSDPTACMIAGHTTQAGEINNNTKSKTLEDGMQGALVNCTVSGTSTFTVNAQLAVDANSLSIVIPSISASASLSSPATGTISYADAKTVNAYGGSCNYYFESGTPETVQSGKIWVSFQCDALQSGMSTCPIAQGYAIFENCLME